MHSLGVNSLINFGSPEAMTDFLASKCPAISGGGLRELVIIGAAEEGRRLVAICAKVGIRVRAILDDHPMRQGGRIGGLTIASSEELTKFDSEIPIIIASHRMLGAVQKYRSSGYKNIFPLAALQVLEPGKFVPHMFYEDWFSVLHHSRHKIEHLYNRLADDFSRQTLDAVISFRLTMDPEYLTPVVTQKPYCPDGLFDYAPDEVFIDGGAFDGDTTRLFIEQCQNKFESIIAFEPDSVTFKKLQANTKDDERILPVNAGLHSTDGMLGFSSSGSRASKITSDVGSFIDTVSIDKFFENKRISYIKMNIEGAEADALYGGSEAIRQYAPKLAISAYHRARDIWEIAEVIESIKPGYNFYMRQQDGGSVELVLYAIAP